MSDSGNGNTKAVRGRIARLTADRGFGFIAGPEGKQYFFHMTDLQNVRFESVSIGDRVDFVPDEQATKGPRATRVTKIGAP